MEFDITMQNMHAVCDILYSNGVVRKLWCEETKKSNGNLNFHLCTDANKKHRNE